MDVLDGRVMHAAGAAGGGIQRALKDGAEDGGADQAPVKIVAGALEYEVPDLVADAGDFDVAGEHAAVDIREGKEFLVLVRIAVFRFLVEDAEEFDELLPEFGGRELRHVVVEQVLGAEKTGVFGVEAEDEAHAELIQRLL